MLKSVLVIPSVIIEIILVYEIILIKGKNILGCDICFRQACLLRKFQFKDLFGIIVKVPPHFISEVGGGPSVTDYFKGILYPDCTMISAENDSHLT